MRPWQSAISAMIFVTDRGDKDLMGLSSFGAKSVPKRKYPDVPREPPFDGEEIDWSSAKEAKNTRCCLTSCFRISGKCDCQENFTRRPHHARSRRSDIRYPSPPDTKRRCFPSPTVWTRKSCWRIRRELALTWTSGQGKPCGHTGA